MLWLLLLLLLWLCSNRIESRDPQKDLCAPVPAEVVRGCGFVLEKIRYDLQTQGRGVQRPNVVAKMQYRRGWGLWTPPLHVRSVGRDQSRVGRWAGSPCLGWGWDGGRRSGQKNDACDAAGRCHEEGTSQQQQSQEVGGKARAMKGPDLTGLVPFGQMESQHHPFFEASSAHASTRKLCMHRESQMEAVAQQLLRHLTALCEGVSNVMQQMKPQRKS